MSEKSQTTCFFCKKPLGNEKLAAIPWARGFKRGHYIAHLSCARTKTALATLLVASAFLGLGVVMARTSNMPTLASVLFIVVTFLATTSIAAGSYHTLK